MATLEWFGMEVAAQLQGMGRAGVRAAADALVEKIKENISTQGPPRSLPGGFPHRDQGDLEASITSVPNAAGDGYEVGSSDPVLFWMELGTVTMAPRPTISRTIAEGQSELAAAAAAGAQSGGGAGAISDSDVATARGRLAASGGTAKGGYKRAGRAGGGKGGGKGGKRKKSAEVQRLEKELKHVMHASGGTKSAGAKSGAAKSAGARKPGGGAG